MKTPHKHKELIHAWAEGATIQSLTYSVKWEDCPMNLPAWDEDTTYRIKPEPKPDVVKYWYIGADMQSCFSDGQFRLHNLKATFDGETGKLKAAEVIA